MTTVAATRVILAAPDRLWSTLQAVGRWPAWTHPLITRARQGDGPTDEAWELSGVLGRAPYTGAFRLVEHEPLRRLYLESLTPATPFESIIHDIELAVDAGATSVTWRAHYTAGFGPGGHIITALLTRRQVEPQLAAVLERLAQEGTATQQAYP